MNQLINITENNGNQAVSARELHEFLEVETQFTKWAERMFEYGFEENKDFILVKKDYNKVSKSNPIDYALTLDCAKEISMLQRTDKGKQARQYFIEVEKKYKKQTIDFSNPDAVLELVQNWKQEKEEKERLQIQNQLQSNQLKQSAPKVAYYDNVLQSKSTYTTSQIAKELGLSATALNKKLHELGVQYRQSETWLLYAKHQDKEYTKTKTHVFEDSNGQKQTSMLTVWTEKGREFVHDMILGVLIMPTNAQLRPVLT